MAEKNAPVSKASRIAEIVALSVMTVVQVVVFITNGLAGTSDAEKFGFKNNTGSISDIFYTQITPDGYAFIIWGFIYTSQTLWIAYAWTFTCRVRFVRTIFIGVYIGFTIVCLVNIAWIYVWGNAIVAWACALLILFNLVFYPTIGMLAAYLYKVQSRVNKIDLWLTRFLPLNGIMFYASWTTVASLINLAAAVEYSAGLNGTDAGTISLSLLLATVVVYFILENTVLDRFFRYVFSVYPVVIWALIAVLVGQSDTASENSRNYSYTIALLVITCILAVIRIVLFSLYTIFRPLKFNGEEKEAHEKKYETV